MILNEYWELVAADLATQFVPSEGGADRGRLNCLVGRFDIENGVADATVLMIDSERVLVGGEGTVRLADQRLRSEERRVGKEGARRGRYRGQPVHTKQKQQ